jgi:hypothetical protein
VTHSRKSARQREKSLERLKAFQERAPRVTVSGERNALATPDAPVAPYKSPERTAWEAAYAGPEAGPLGATWPADGRHVPYMRWALPTNSPAPRGPLNRF